MLAGSVSLSPRPRPPARARRTSAKTSPPPPYHAPSPSHDRSVQGQPPRVSSESILADWDRLVFSAKTDRWDERSREELSGLLTKADELIKGREHELNVTTAVCKSLYENNLELKNRHKALLARLPSSPTTSSTGNSPSPSPTLSDSRRLQSPHYYGDASRPSSRADAHTSGLHPPHIRHHRRVSVSPSDLALLSDENAQLLAKLEKLEAESIQADQAGRKKLRGLEKEIQGLREELEKTRAKSDELEARARAASVSVAQRDEELSRKKREREEKVRALRGKPPDDLDDGEVRDFAPGNILTKQGSTHGLGHSSGSKYIARRYVSEAVPRPLRSKDDTVSVVTRQDHPQNALKRSLSQPGLLYPTDMPIHGEPPSTLTHEYALVSQLLLKIKELEETNVQITEQQARTTAQLQSVQKDADSIRLVYESLGSAESVQWIAESEDQDPQSGHEEADETVRFSSLRRTLSADASLDFVSGIEADMLSSLRQSVIPDHVPLFSNPRARRSVVGLFDSPAGVSPATISDHHSTPSVHSLTIPGLPPVPFVPQPSSMSSRSPSPIGSNNLSGIISPTYEAAPGVPTLDHELGAAFDDVWEGPSGGHHLGTPSLASFGTVDQQSLSPDSVPSSPPLSMLSILGPEGTAHRTDASTSALPVLQGTTRLRPGTWRGQPEGSETAAERKRRKSETIRMRTRHWNQSRFGGTLLRAESPARADASRPSTPLPERLASMFDAVVDTIGTGTGSLSPDRSMHDLVGGSGSPTEPVRTRSGSGTVATRTPPQRGFVAFVLEVWLWLQFAIIIVVFVWAMAKRGPKSVLEGIGRKREGSGRG